MGEFETVLTKTNQKKVARNTIILLALIFKHFLRMTHGIKKKKRYRLSTVFSHLASLVTRSTPTLDAPRLSRHRPRLLRKAPNANPSTRQ